MKWANNPRYQKAIQRLLRLGPEQRAIFDTVAADDVFADEQVRNQLRHMDLASRKIAQDRQYKLSSDYQGLREKEFDITKSAGQTATNLGWANMVLSGFTGLQGLSEKKQEAKRKRNETALWRKETQRLG